MTELIVLDEVGRTFPGPPHEVRALDACSLSVRTGELVAVVGASGSGKSTLLNVVGLLDRPTSGRYYLGGVEVSRLVERQRTRLRADAIGFVFQGFELMPRRSALENVMLAGAYCGESVRERRRLATAALERVHLGHRALASPPTLSGGERQRVAIARALCRRPPLLLCDEPTGNLDSESSEAVLDLLVELHRDGRTILLITHDVEVAARAQRVVTMRDGRLHDGP